MTWISLKPSMYSFKFFINWTKRFMTWICSKYSNLTWYLTYLMKRLVTRICLLCLYQNFCLPYIYTLEYQQSLIYKMSCVSIVGYILKYVVQKTSLLFFYCCYHLKNCWIIFKLRIIIKLLDIKINSILFNMNCIK